jgi:uncharacterized protein YcaQ
VRRGSLSRAEARRVALAAQGFAERRPARVDLGSLVRLLDRIALLQIDSVNVAVRAQYMPVFSRLGPYDVGILHRAASRRPRRVFEYWGHEASFIRVGLYPALRFRMREAHDHMWGSTLRIAQARPEFVKRVLEDVRAHGPVTARQIEDDASRDRADWGWNWSDAKKALEYLFYTGDITSAGRTISFERRYDLTERVIPRAVYEQPEIDKAEAHRRLVRAAATAHGVATAQCLRDYFRTSPEPTRTAITELVEAGELLPVTIDGWRRPAYLFHRARLPRQVRARALLSPFDPLIFERTRTEQLFDFRYRIEIYVPAHKRVHGYYVFPFLYGDRLAARVDLKSDRAAGVLRVVGVFAENQPSSEMVAALAGSLTEMATWQGLTAVSVAGHGDLAAALASTLAPAPAAGAVDLAAV